MSVNPPRYQSQITTVTMIVDGWWGMDTDKGSSSGVMQHEIEFEPGYIDSVIPLGEEFKLIATDGTAYYCRDFIVEPQGPIIDEH